MESKFKVVMKKDEEVLKDFLSFTYRAKGGVDRMKLRIFAIGLVTIGYLAAKGGGMIAGIIVGAVGIGLFVISLCLPQVAIWRMKKMDMAYRNQTELTYAFTNGNIYVYENGELGQSVSGYNHVSCFYEDEKNFYVGINNEDLFLLPKKSFVEGEAAEFVEFIEKKSNEKAEFLPMLVKNKWIKMRVKMKQADAEHDAKAEELRRQAKEKRKKK